MTAEPGDEVGRDDEAGSGDASGTGDDAAGLDDARAMGVATAQALGIDAAAVLVWLLAVEGLIADLLNRAAFTQWLPAAAGRGPGVTWPAALPLIRPDHVLYRGLTAVDVACALDDGTTRVHMLSRSGTLPRVQVEAGQLVDPPAHLTEDAVIARAVWSELTAETVLGLLDRELNRFGFSRSEILSDAAHAAHWADPLADPAVRTAVELARYELLVGFELTPEQLRYNATR